MLDFGWCVYHGSNWFMMQCNKPVSLKFSTRASRCIHGFDERPLESIFPDNKNTMVQAICEWSMNPLSSAVKSGCDDICFSNNSWAPGQHLHQYIIWLMWLQPCSSLERFTHGSVLLWSMHLFFGKICPFFPVIHVIRCYLCHKTITASMYRCRI